MKKIFLLVLLSLPFSVFAGWEQAYAYISRAGDQCVYTGVVYSQYTTNLGAICSTIERNFDFSYRQHCPQNQLIFVSRTLYATASSTNTSPAQGSNLHLSGLSSGSGLPMRWHDKNETVDCSDCTDGKPKDTVSTNALPSDCDNSSPIVIDLHQDGFAFGGLENPVSFWIWPQYHFKQVLNWVQPNSDDAFLALDLNKNGMIDNGGELFGDGTFLQLEETYAVNGLVALAQYDNPELGGNNDGTLSAKDAIWQHLLLWLDQDSDGISLHHELIPLKNTDIIQWHLVAEETQDRDHHQNWLRFKGTATSAKKVYDWVDVYFKRHAELEKQGRITPGDLLSD